MIDVHIKDGLAVTKFIHWVKNSNVDKLDEIKIAINLGADDIDVVVDYIRFKEGDYDYIVENIGNYCNIELIEDRSLIALQGPLAEKVLVKFSNNFASALILGRG